MARSKTQKGTTLTSIIHKHTFRRSLVPIAALLIFALSFVVDLNITSASNTTEEASVIDLTTSSQKQSLLSKVSVKSEWMSSILGPNPVGTTIVVNTTSQAIAKDGFCSLPEAIYAANLDESLALDETQRDVFVGLEIWKPS